MELTEGRITMDSYIFFNMSTELTLLKRDIKEKQDIIYQLERGIEDKNILIESLFETIKSLGGK